MRRREFIAATGLAFLLAPSGLLYANARRFAQPVQSSNLNLPVDHGPHPDFKTEWWYFTGWFESPTLQSQFGVQITFFRSAPNVDLSNPSRFAPDQLILAHAAVALPEQGKLIHADVIQRHDELGSKLAGRSMGNSTSLLQIGLPGWKLSAISNDHWVCQIEAESLELALDIYPTQAPWLQGDNGFSRKGPILDQSSYYITQPHMQASGQLSLNNGKHAVKGSFWMDHEWSSTVLAENAQGWDWVGLHGQDGSALMAFRIRSKNAIDPPVWTHAALRHANGEIQNFEKVAFQTLEQWTSPRTATSYPVSQKLALDGLSFDLRPLMPDQELDARTSSGTLYWEGAVEVKCDGKPWGRGYLEMTGYDRPMTL